MNYLLRLKTLPIVRCDVLRHCSRIVCKYCEPQDEQRGFGFAGFDYLGKFCPDQQHVAISDATGALRVLSLSNGHQTAFLKANLNNHDSLLAASRSLRFVRTRNVRIWDVNTGKEVLALRKDVSGTEVATHVDSDAITAKDRGTDQGSTPDQASLTLYVGRISKAAISPDWRYFATVHSNSNCKQLRGSNKTPVRGSSRSWHNR